MRGSIFKSAMTRRGRTGCCGWGKGGGVLVFCCCVQSAISLMKWSKVQGEIAMDGNFRKRGHGCPFFPPRSAGQSLTISLVKSDWKPQQKTRTPPPFPQPQQPVRPRRVMALLKMDPLPFQYPLMPTPYFSSSALLLQKDRASIH